MKKFMLFLKVAVFAGFIGFTLVSCSSDSLLEEQSVKNEAVIDLGNDEKVSELILFMNESVMQFPSYSQVAETRSLRGFFRWLRDVIKCDAYGYLWGITRGGGFKGSLVPAVACSIIAAVQFSKDNGLTTNDWILNSQWAVFPTSQDFYKIGSDHNLGIYNMYRSDPQLFSKSNSTIVTSSISSLKGMGFSNAKELKAAISICGNSRLLWKER